MLPGPDGVHLSNKGNRVSEQVVVIQCNIL